MPLDAGTIVVDGKPVMLTSPGDAVRANIGISLVPEDRKTEALFLKLDGQSNVALPTIGRRLRHGLIDRRAETEAVARVLDIVHVQHRALYSPASAFSGGNQQKIAIAKWLLAESRILLMFDPTRGVDVGTKHEIYVLIRDFARAGGAVLFCSTEIPELVNLCDRVLVIYGRQDRARTGRRRDRRGSDPTSGARRRRIAGGVLMDIASGLVAPVAQERRKRLGKLYAIKRARGAIIIALVFVALFAATTLTGSGSFSYFEASFMSSGGVTLALAAMGRTLVILTGGFDLSVGATVSLVNVVLATTMGDTALSQIGVTLLGIVVGAGIGAFTGFFVAVIGLQSIVVTLPTMFLIRGVTLLVLDNPGGTIAPGFSKFFTGAAIHDILPAAVLVILAAVAAWLFLKGTRFGIRLYAVGSDEESARAAGVPVRMTKFLTYVVAGMFYGAAGVFISEQTGSGDPLVGNPLLAFRLVAEGYAGVEDVDIGVRDGLGLRWAFMGPFETIDLNAPGASPTTSPATKGCIKTCR